MNCIGIITSAKKAGNYVFELQVFAREDANSKQDFNQPIATLRTDAIEIKPALPPKIVEFSATKPTYQESAPQAIASPAILSSTVPVSPAPTTSPAASQTLLPLPSPRFAEPTTGLIRLNWEVNNPCWGCIRAVGSREASQKVLRLVRLPIGSRLPSAWLPKPGVAHTPLWVPSIGDAISHERTESDYSHGSQIGSDL